MATLHVSFEGTKEMQAAFKRMTPAENRRIMPGILNEIAKPLQRNAADIQITKGGRGKGKMLKALPHRLTSRRGGSGLVGTIGINRSPLPKAIEVGTHLAYGAVHEYGGSVGFPSRVIKAHTRTVAFGKKVAPFTVPKYFRSGYYAEYPKRPFLAPAWDAIRPRAGAIAVAEWKKEARL